MQYISELISVEEMSKWKRGDSVLISAGTGKGKSHFILNTLREFAENRNEKILLLVPRTAIKTQFNQQLDPFDTTIIVETYQWLENKIVTNEEYDLSFDYIVADESHYFLDDSNFNEGTGLSFEFLIKSRSTKIFMSATGQNIYALLQHIGHTPAYNYSFEEQFENIEQIYFYPYDKNLPYAYVHQKLQEIQGTHEKALVFINNVTEAKKLAKKFEGDSILLHSGKNLQDTINELMKEEMFDTQFLITTSLLDTGVTFKDEDLKHIFVDHVNINSIIQMLGRKRSINSSDTVVAHIRDFNNLSIGGMLSSHRKRLEPLEYCREYGYGAFLRRYPFGKEGNHKIQGILTLTSNDDMGYYNKVNPLYYSNLKILVYYFKSILNSEKGYKGVVAKMLNKENDYQVIGEQTKRKEIIEYLRSINDIRLYTKEEKDELINMIDGKYEKKQIRSPKGLTGYLDELNIPCEIYSHRDTRRVITNKEGEQIPNPYRFKTFWRIWLEEELLKE